MSPHHPSWIHEFRVCKIEKIIESLLVQLNLIIRLGQASCDNTFLIRYFPPIVTTTLEVMEYILSANMTYSEQI